MGRELSFSVGTDFLRTAYTQSQSSTIPMGSGESPKLDFVDYLNDKDLPIELYVSGPIETGSTIEPSKKYVDFFDLNVEGVHLTRLYELGAEDGDRELRTRVHNTQVSNQGNPRFKPSTMTFHPPRLSETDLQDFGQALYNVARNIDRVQRDIYTSEEMDGDLALENVASSLNYLLKNAEDVEEYQRIAEEKEFPNFGFTFDTGHADDPAKMARSMGDDIKNVHLHDRASKDSENEKRLRNRYQLPDDVAAGTSERDGELTHLPPGSGELDLEEILNILDDIDYQGNIVMEIHPSYARFGSDQMIEDVEELEEMI